MLAWQAHCQMPKQTRDTRLKFATGLLIRKKKAAFDERSLRTRPFYPHL